MAYRNSKELIEAVFFFGRKGITKEMRYTEFEAVLDGVVGMTGLSSREVQAAYLKITPSLEVHSVVLFLIEFDDRGFADQDWNIPLRHLADTAGPGPDLGQGPIRLACRSQCSVSWYQRELWEPKIRDGLNHFQLIHEAVRRNKLGIITDDEPTKPLASPAAKAPADPPTISEQVDDVGDFEDLPVISDQVEPQALTGYSEADLKAELAKQAREYQEKLALLTRRQKQRIHGLEEQHKEEVEQVKRAMRNEAQTYRNRIQELEQQTNQSSVLGDKLQSSFRKLERDNLVLQEQFDTLKERHDELKAEHLAALHSQQSSTADEQDKVVALKEALTEKNFEIDEFKEELRNAEARIEALTDQVAELEQSEDNNDDLMDRLDGLDLVFVAYHPGAGHISMPSRQLADYLERPMAFAAQKCSVTLEQYKAWLVHYDSPECNECGVPVKRVDQPSDFESGTHNFCSRHRVVSGNVTAFRKSS
ncbi:hypothetical protein [Saccharospirillum alexandrii]|uniref:hypothetical protein n=1 Tax=Saccharospirillum alexandrii TaxID=2448477 RepID=UPI000FDB51D1|nr:hypothetical protein [Saccharospirillum alexandrii]